MTKEVCHVSVALSDFEKQVQGIGKGGFGVLLVVTDNAKKRRFPLNPDDFLSKSGGQVSGASGAAANKILKAHGVNARLSAEGGRTNRGSISLMRKYIVSLNDLHSRGELDLDRATAHWIARIEKFFASAPFRVRLGDQHISIRPLIEDLLEQSQQKQKSRPGSTFTGTLMQHLTAAKLRCLLKEGAPKPHGASDADSSRNTGGDFEVRDAVIHVTSAPTSQLLEKCRTNLESGGRPIIITLAKSVSHAQALAEELGIEKRVEFWAFDQFLSTNVHEWGGFQERDIREYTRNLFQTYNEIIDELHEEPSLKIAY